MTAEIGGLKSMPTPGKTRITLVVRLGKLDKRNGRRESLPLAVLFLSRSSLALPCRTALRIVRHCWRGPDVTDYKQRQVVRLAGTPRELLDGIEDSRLNFLNR